MCKTLWKRVRLTQELSTSAASRVRKSNGSRLDALRATVRLFWWKWRIASQNGAKVWQSRAVVPARNKSYSKYVYPITICFSMRIYVPESFWHKSSTVFGIAIGWKARSDIMVSRQMWVAESQHDLQLHPVWLCTLRGTPFQRQTDAAYPRTRAGSLHPLNMGLGLIGIGYRWYRGRKD